MDMVEPVPTKLPDDEMGRFWVDLSYGNPHLVDQFRPALVAFLAHDKQGNPGLAGTGLTLAGGPDCAIVLTAKHVLTEGMLKIQRPVARHHPSALFVPDNAHHPILNEEMFRALWMGTNSGDVLFGRHVCFHENLDVACCIVQPQEHCRENFHPAAIPFDTYRPKVGEVVHMVSQTQLGITNRTEPTGPKNTGQTISINRNVSIRRGVVTGVYPEGYRQYKWQCFTTSIPAEPGMSGGFVFVPREGESIAACGIVCADNSPDEAKTSFLSCGESVIACSWTALALKIPTYMANDAPQIPLLEGIRTGIIGSATGPLSDITYQDNGDNTGRLIRHDNWHE